MGEWGAVRLGVGSGEDAMAAEWAPTRLLVGKAGREEIREPLRRRRRPERSPSAESRRVGHRSGPGVLACINDGEDRIGRRRTCIAFVIWSLNSCWGFRFLIHEPCLLYLNLASMEK